MRGYLSVRSYADFKRRTIAIFNSPDQACYARDHNSTLQIRGYGIFFLRKFLQQLYSEYLGGMSLQKIGDSLVFTASGAPVTSKARRVPVSLQKRADSIGRAPKPAQKHANPRSSSEMGLSSAAPPAARAQASSFTPPWRRPQGSAVFAIPSRASTARALAPDGLPKPPNRVRPSVSRASLRPTCTARAPDRSRSPQSPQRLKLADMLPSRPPPPSGQVVFHFHMS